MGDAPMKTVSEPRIVGDKTSAEPAGDCKVAEYLVDALADVGVRYIFGVVGGTVFPWFTATAGRQAQIVMTKHEAGAAFMADGYARASGGIGACVATSGPGATNLTPGSPLPTPIRSRSSCSPGRSPRSPSGRGALQESSTEGVDIVDVFKQVTRYSILTFRADRIPAIWQKALRMAMGGRPWTRSPEPSRRRAGADDRETGPGEYGPCIGRAPTTGMRSSRRRCICSARGGR